MKSIRLPDKHEYKMTTTDTLRAFLVGRGAKRVLEVGCDIGLTTALLAQAAEHVTALDTDPRKLAKAQEVATMLGVQDKITFLCKTAGEVHGDWDLVFIDAMHDYESVKADTEAVRERNLAQHYRIVWHDYGLDAAGVKRYVDENYPDRDLVGEAADWNPHGGPVSDYEAATVMV